MLSQTTKTSLQSRLKGNNLILLGMGYYFPGKAITNKYFEDNYNLSDKWIVKHTGVSARHYPDTNIERHTEMGMKAALRAIKQASIGTEDIDLIIGTSSTTRASYNPSSINNKYMDIAPIVQDLIGAKKAIAFDVSALACSGFLGATLVVHGILNSMNLKNALIVCSESPKDILNFNFKNSSLFGSGASATIWQSSNDKEGLIDLIMHSDGQYFNAFDIDSQDKIKMDGKLVGEIAQIKLTDALLEILSKNNLSINDIDWFVPHQANLNLISQIAENVNCPKEKILINLPYRGNTSSVGMPSCLSEFINNQTVKVGDIILTCTIGRGFTWGAAIIKYI